LGMKSHLNPKRFGFSDQRFRNPEFAAKITT
jgi:hypothetical protein